MCPMCGEDRNDVETRRLNTAFVNDEENYVTCCSFCYQDMCDYYDERWKDYYDGLI